MKNQTHLVAYAFALTHCLVCAFGQPESSSKKQQPLAPKVAPHDPRTLEKGAQPSGLVEFSDRSIKIEEVGLTMRLPVGCASERISMSTQYNSQSLIQIVAEDQSWRVNVQTPRTSNPDMTCTMVVDDVVTKLIDAVTTIRGDPDLTKPQRIPAEKRGVVLDRQPNAKTPSLSIRAGERDLPIERVYLALSRGDNEIAQIRGYTVAQVAPAQFVTFDLLVPETEYARVRPIYEAMIASIRIGNPDDVTTARGAGIDAGLALMRGLSTEDYNAVIRSKPERWVRLYRPAASAARTDAEEIGYTRIRLSQGQRGQLDPSRPKSRWSASEKQDGYIVEIDARFRDGGRLVDSKAVYFMSPDRNEEAWTVRNAIRDEKGAKGRDGKRVLIGEATEIGGRVGTSMSVTIRVSGQPDTEVKPQIQSEAYINRVEVFLLPQFMLRKKAAAEFAFYAWQSEHQRIKLRRDNLEQPVDMPGVWRLTTHIGEEPNAQVALFKENGDLIRTTMANGTIWEPIEADALAKLWQSKGLPMD